MNKLLTLLCILLLSTVSWADLQNVNGENIERSVSEYRQNDMVQTYIPTTLTIPDGLEMTAAFNAARLDVPGTIQAVNPGSFSNWDKVIIHTPESDKYMADQGGWWASPGWAFFANPIYGIGGWGKIPLFRAPNAWAFDPHYDHDGITPIPVLLSTTEVLGRLFCQQSIVILGHTICLIP